MPVISERAEAITAYIQENAGAKIIDSWPMEFGGNIEYAPIYSIPITLLCYNLKNGRYTVELARLQADEGYQLDPIDDQDRAKLRRLLLSLDSEQSELLKDDLRDKGQLYPGVITRDGFVINANRRMAILEVLHEEHPDGRFEDLKVQILPEGVGDRDLWRLEAGLQLSRDTRANYTPINELLKLREGREAGLSTDEISATMFGRSRTWVTESLNRLEIMEQYLTYFGWDGQYHLLERSNEQFIEVQKNIKALERDGFEAGDIYQWLICQFELVRAGISNWDLRHVKKIAADDEAAERLREVVIAESQPGKTLGQAVVREAFDSAKTTIESKDEAEKPGVLLGRAVANLKAIDPKHANLVTGPNRYHVRKLRQSEHRARDSPYGQTAGACLRCDCCEDLVGRESAAD